MGATKTSFSAQLHIVSQSPVLAQICSAPFAENLRGIISPPGDLPVDVGRLLEYLYSRTYSAKGDNEPQSRDPEVLLELAGMDILADKYHLIRLKVVTVSKISEIIKMSFLTKTFLQITHDIYKNTPETEPHLQKILCRRFPAIIRRVTETSSAYIKELVHGRGMLASDICAAQIKAFNRSETALVACEAEVEE